MRIETVRGIGYRILVGVKFGHAARVAAVTTAAIAVVYVACVTVLNLVISAHLTAQIDGRLGDSLNDLRRHPATELAQQVSRPVTASDSDDDGDGDGSPVLSWLVGADHRVVARSPGAPALPASLTAGAWDGRTVTAAPGSVRGLPPEAGRETVRTCWWSA